MKAPSLRRTGDDRVSVNVDFPDLRCNLVGDTSDARCCDDCRNLLGLIWPHGSLGFICWIDGMGLGMVSRWSCSQRSAGSMAWASGLWPSGTVYIGAQCRPWLRDTTGTEDADAVLAEAGPVQGCDR